MSVYFFRSYSLVHRGMKGRDRVGSKEVFQVGEY